MSSRSTALKDYLKKYTSNDYTEKKKKKKKKKGKPVAEGVLIVDENPTWQQPVKLNEVEDSADEDKHQVDEEIEVKHMKRLEQLRSRHPFGAISEDGSGWVSVSQNSKNLEIENQNSDIYPPPKKSSRNDSPSPRPNQEPVSASDVDLSPPQQPHKHFHSAPETKKMHASSGQRACYDSPSPEPYNEASDPNKVVSDLSLPCRQRDNFKSSPEPRRKSSYTGDMDSDVSSPRRAPRGSGYREDSHAASAIDLSPPRKVKNGKTDFMHISTSKAIFKTGGDTVNLASSVYDLSPPRKKRKESSLLIDRAKTGLASGVDIKKEIDRKKKEDLLRFKALDPSVSSQNAEAVFRNKSTGERMSKEEFLKSKKDKQKKEEKPKRKMGFCADDEVENPCFDEDNDFIQYPIINSSNHYSEGPFFLSTMASILQCDDETISDNEKINIPTLKSAKVNESSSWSEASMEVKALICLHENSGGSSSHGVAQKAYKSCKGGGKAKSKRKFSFHFQPCKEDLPLVGGDGNRWPLLEKIALPNTISAAVHKDMDKSMVGNLLVVGEEVEPPEDHIATFELSRQHDFKENSMGIERKGIGGEHIVLDKYTSPVGEEFLSVDDLPEVLDSGPSSDDEDNHQNTKSIIPRTMADKFHEVFGTVSVNDERPPSALPDPL